jgi:hypothetical protein
MTFCRSADCRIAGHSAYGGFFHGHQQNRASHTSRRKTSFNAGMSAACDYNIILLVIAHLLSFQ